MESTPVFVDTPLASRLSARVRATHARGPADERQFQIWLVDALGDCSVECGMTFAAPAIPPRTPPESAVAECQAKGRALSAGGVDACVGNRRKLDILWRVDGQHVPIEVKLVVTRKSDVHGYRVLKVLHRLERLRAVAGEGPLSDQRFVVFAAHERLYWTDGPPEPVPFRLFEGRTIEPGFWVQYPQQSAWTRWLNYPPFFLANAYQFTWQDAPPFGRFLIVPVWPQRAREMAT